MTVTFRAERSGDEDRIHVLIETAFVAAPHSDGTEADIVRRLRSVGALTLSLVATDGGAIIGHTAFSPVTIDGHAKQWFGLGPVAVDPRRQKNGIGKRLIEMGLEQIRSEGAAGCVVLGDPAYYGRFGFKADSKLVYPGVPAEYFQALSFGSEAASGTIAYHPAFAG